MSHFDRATECIVCDGISRSRTDLRLTETGTLIGIALKLHSTVDIVASVLLVPGIRTLTVLYGNPVGASVTVEVRFGVLVDTSTLVSLNTLLIWAVAEGGFADHVATAVKSICFQGLKHGVVTWNGH